MDISQSIALRVEPESGDEFHACPAFAEVSREVRPAAPRYRNEIGKFSVRRALNFAACGRCVEICRRDVHIRPNGYRSIVRPFDYRCIGVACAETDGYCVEACPQQALSLTENPVFETMGDCRWTPDLLVSTWQMAETGRQPASHLECEVGASGGGLDRLRFKFPASPPAALSREEISTKLLLNRRGDSRPKIAIDVPWYGGGMSFGSTNIHALLGKARVAKAFNTFTCTGEGGYPERFTPYKDHVITQVATGLFGVREETIQRARIVEFKYAQGAKPGLGGHLLGDKNTPSVAAMRETTVGVSLFSPFPFHSVYSVEDHKKHLDWIAHVNPQALLSAKVSTPNDVDMVAVGVYYAGGHIVHLDGSYGGTGAAPEHRQEEHRHADRIRDRPGPPVLTGRRHPRQGRRDRQRRHPRPVGHRQGDCLGGRRLRGRHQRVGGPGLHSLRGLRERAGLRSRHRHHRRRTAGNGHGRLVYAAAGEPVQRLAGDAGRHSLSPGSRLRGVVAGPDRSAHPFGLREPELTPAMSHSMTIQAAGAAREALGAIRGRGAADRAEAILRRAQPCGLRAIGSCRRRKPRAVAA